MRIITYPRSDVNTLYSELRITKSDTEDSGTYVCQTTFYNDILKVAKHNLSVIIGKLLLAIKEKRKSQFINLRWKDIHEFSLNRNFNWSTVLVWIRDSLFVDKILFSKS